MRHQEEQEAFVPGLAPLADLETLQFFGGEGAQGAGAEAAAAAGVASPATELPYREQLESSFGTDLSHITAHKGSGASAACQALGAHAYATGNHVVFGSDSPSMFQVAHEVAHTFQQGGGGIRKYAKVGERGDPFERQADAVANQVVNRQRVDVGSLKGGPSSTPQIQRDDGHAPATNTAPPAPRSYLPPPEITLGILPADTDVVSVGTTDLYDAMNNAVYFQVPFDAGAYTATFSRMASFDFVRGNLRNMTNGGGVTEVLPPHQNSTSEYTGHITIRARISNARFQSADGVAISSGSSGGPSTSSSSGITDSVGVNATAGGKVGDPKAGGEGSIGIGGAASDGSTQSSGGGWAGGGTTGMAATASVRFTFDVSFSVTVSIDHEPRTWSAIATLGLGYLAASGVKSRTMPANGNGVLRAAAARCIPVM